MSAGLEAVILSRLVVAWLGCSPDISARALPDNGIASIEVVLPGARLAYIDIHPERWAASDARDRRRARLRRLGVPFAAIRSLLDARYALEDLGVLDPRAV